MDVTVKWKIWFHKITSTISMKNVILDNIHIQGFPLMTLTAPAIITGEFRTRKIFKIITKIERLLVGWGERQILLEINLITYTQNNVFTKNIFIMDLKCDILIEISAFCSK